MGWDCGKCGIRVEPGSSNASECAVSVLVQYAMHLHVVPHAAHLRYADACFFFGHVDEWALDNFSAHLNGTFVCSSTAYFHVTFMNSGYVQIEVCYKHRNSHISGMC